MAKIRFSGWMDEKHVAWLRKKAASQEVPTTYSAVLRSVVGKAMKMDERGGQARMKAGAVDRG